jgi:hypothetical protein
VRGPVSNARSENRFPRVGGRPVMPVQRLIQPQTPQFFFFFYLYMSRITSSGLFLFRITSDTVNPFKTFRQDSLDGGSVHLKASTCTEQYNTETRGHTPISGAGFEPTVAVFVKLGLNILPLWFCQVRNCSPTCPVLYAVLMGRWCGREKGAAPGRCSRRFMML